MISLAVLAIAGYAAWNVGPVYIADYSLSDHIVQTARRPRDWRGDRRIREMLMKEVLAQRLQDEIPESAFKITTRDGTRKIELQYKRTVEILPGWTHTFVFEHKVDERYF